MQLKLSFIAACAAGMFLLGCSENSTNDAPASRPAVADQDNRDLPVNTSPGQTGNFDPAKEQTAPPSAPTTTISFVAYEHDFGTLDEGESVTHMFEFTNTGSEPLILDNCKGSCGCTVPKCPKEPSAPGESGQIEVKFNSKGKKNSQTKKVTINANTDPAQTFLTITAYVNPAVGG